MEIMEKFAVNYNDLQGDLTPRPNAFRYADVKHRLKKVAYDIVRFVDGDDISGLWQVQQTDDGDVIVAQYDDTANFAEVEKTAAVETSWRALADKSGGIHIFYKDSPVTKIALASIGIPAEDADVVCRYLPEKLATNEVLASNLLAEMSGSNFKELVKAHPELSSLGFQSEKCQPGDPMCSDIGDKLGDKLPCGCSEDCDSCKKSKATKGNCTCKK